MKQIEYELPDDPSQIVDEFSSPGSQYSLVAHSSAAIADETDEFVLEATPQTLRRFARLFAQLADRGERESYHFHLGVTSEDAPQGPGWRIVSTNNVDIYRNHDSVAVAASNGDLAASVSRASQVLRDKRVAKLFLPCSGTIGLLFRDGTRLHVLGTGEELRLSVEQAAEDHEILGGA